MPTRRQALARMGAALAPALAGRAFAQDAATWERIAAAARGQTVVLHTPAGLDPVRSYLQWAAGQVDEMHGIRLEHRPQRNMQDTVQRLQADKAADKAIGSVDLLWLQSGQLASLKSEGLLYGPLTRALRNHRLLDEAGQPGTRWDDAEPVDGMAVPWGMTQLTFMADRQRLAAPPQNLQELLALARSQPGGISYPRLPDADGAAFVQQMLLDLAPERQALYRPATAAALERSLPAVTAYLDQLHPHLWQGGKQFAKDPAHIRQLMNAGELLFNLSLNPLEAAREIAAQRLPASVVSYQFPQGTLSHAHYLAVAFNARSKAGALLLADFLLSPRAQARKADPAVWGDATLLRVDALPLAEQALFQRPPLPGQLTQAAPALGAPHPSWAQALEREWNQRYAA